MESDPSASKGEDELTAWGVPLFFFPSTVVLCQLTPFPAGTKGMYGGT